MEFVVPTVLQCNRFVVKNTRKGERVVKDYEFDYYVGGMRKVILDGISYKIVPGTVVFRKPMQFTVGYGDYDGYILSLDFDKHSLRMPQTYIRHRSDAPQSKNHARMFDDFPPVFIPVHQKSIRELYDKLAGCSYPNVVNERLQAQYVEELLLLLLSDAKRYLRECSANDDRNYVERICNYINQNYNKKISIKDLATLVALNPNHMIRLFRSRLDTTPIAYLNETRLFYAKTMLIDSSLPINEIAVNSGYCSAAYFSKAFKNYYGVSPKEYRASHMLFDKEL